MDVVLVVVLTMTLVAEFVNGWTDAPNAIATVIATKTLTPLRAVIMAAILNTIGVLSGTAVATTIGKGIVDTSVVDLTVVAGAVVSTALWGATAARWGLPTSESHAIVAGISGAALAAEGPSVLLWGGWQKVLIGLVLSSFVGFAGSFVLAKLIRNTSAVWKPSTGKVTFARMQIASSMFTAFNHGLNDGQKFMGIFAMALVIAGVLPEFSIPRWVIFLCAAVMGLGTLTGGWRIIRKMGLRLVRLTTWQGFAAETGASLTMLLAARFGIPLSTTHTITTSIMGVGASGGFSGVRWRTALEIAMAWFLTFPICFLIGAMTYFVVHGIAGFGAR
jgi:PiT family inorganic phosphate transporter